MDSPTETQKCTRCHVVKLQKLFKFRENTGKYYKTCIKCCEKHKCDLCEYKCSSKIILAQHIKSVHEKIIKDCDAKFSKKVKLTQHIKASHNRIKEYKCRSCGPSGGDLTQHKKPLTDKRNISLGEHQVIKALSDLGFTENTDYSYNTTYNNLSDVRFDFLFKDHKIVIEYDGRQHFESVCFGGISQYQADENFIETQINDALKNRFCIENDLRMIRISYKDFPNILRILSKKLFDIVNWIG